MSLSATVTIVLDRARRLKFDINALAEADDLLRDGVSASIASGDVRISDVRTLLWAGLKWEDPRLTREGAGELLQSYVEGGGQLRAVTSSIIEALIASKLFSRAEKKTTPAASLSDSESGSAEQNKTPTAH